MVKPARDDGTIKCSTKRRKKDQNPRKQTIAPRNASLATQEWYNVQLQTEWVCTRYIPILSVMIKLYNTTSEKRPIGAIDISI